MSLSSVAHALGANADGKRTDAERKISDADMAQGATETFPRPSCITSTWDAVNCLVKAFEAVQAAAASPRSAEAWLGLPVVWNLRGPDLSCSVQIGTNCTSQQRRVALASLRSSHVGRERRFQVGARKGGVRFEVMFAHSESTRRARSSTSRWYSGGLRPSSFQSREVECPMLKSVSVAFAASLFGHPDGHALHRLLSRRRMVRCSNS